MTRPLTGLVIVLALTASGAAARSPAARSPAARSTAACPDSDLQAFPHNLDRVAGAIVCELNARRAEAGLAPLRRQSQLDASSQFHTDDMAESRFLAHEQPGHPSVLTRIRRSGYFKGVTGGLYAENIADAPQEEATAAEVVTAWMLSPAHSEKILYAGFREIGVGARVVGPDPVFYADRPSVVYTTDYGRRYWRRRCAARRAHATQAPIRYCTVNRRRR
jgi:uncharacterized protein YkwD